MSIFAPSHISTVTERSDASVIHQNFVKLHSEVQALKQYVKKLPTEIPPANEQKISEVKTAQNLIWDDSFENVTFEESFYTDIPTGIYPVSSLHYKYPDPSTWQFGGTSPSVYVAGTKERYLEKVRVLFGRVAAAVDGTVDWDNFDPFNLIKFDREPQPLPSNGKSVPSYIVPVHAFAEQSGGYNLSAHVASFDNTTTNGQGVMSAVLLSTSGSGDLIRIAKKWELSFPINAGEKFKWYRYSLSISMEEIGAEHNGVFLIVFESTSPCLVDGVLFAPIPELPLYYPVNFFIPPFTVL